MKKWMAIDNCYNLARDNVDMHKGKNNLTMVKFSFNLKLKLSFDMLLSIYINIKAF